MPAMTQCPTTATEPGATEQPEAAHAHAAWSRTPLFPSHNAVGSWSTTMLVPRASLAWVLPCSAANSTPAAGHAHRVPSLSLVSFCFPSPRPPPPMHLSMSVFNRAQVSKLKVSKPQFLDLCVLICAVCRLHHHRDVPGVTSSHWLTMFLNPLCLHGPVAA